MTRVAVYSAALVAFLAATAMTLAAIITPDWLAYTVRTSGGSVFSRKIGLHQDCTSAADPPCRHFPSAGDCEGNARYFCSLWRTTGFLMSFATVAELATIVGFMIIMGGGKLKREGGWKILGSLLALVAGIQFAAIAIVAYLFDNHEAFVVPGWRLDTSWILCTVSSVVAVFCGTGLAISAYVIPPEEGYEFLVDPSGV